MKNYACMWYSAGAYEPLALLRGAQKLLYSVYKSSCWARGSLSGVINQYVSWSRPQTAPKRRESGDIIWSIPWASINFLRRIFHLPVTLQKTSFVVATLKTLGYFSTMTAIFWHWKNDLSLLNCKLWIFDKARGKCHLVGGVLAWDNLMNLVFDHTVRSKTPFHFATIASYPGCVRGETLLPCHLDMKLYHSKNTWVTLTTFLGCLSCISVTKKCYQIGFLESSLRSFFNSFSEDLFSYNPGISVPKPCNHARNSPEADV